MKSLIQYFWIVAVIQRSAMLMRDSLAIVIPKNSWPKTNELKFQNNWTYYNRRCHVVLLQAPCRRIFQSWIKPEIKHFLIWYTFIFTDTQFRNVFRNSFLTRGVSCSYQWIYLESGYLHFFQCRCRVVSEQVFSRGKVPTIFVDNLSRI